MKKFACFSLMVILALTLIGCQGLEKKIVGKYKVNVDTSGMPADKKAMADAAKSMLSGMTLELKADKTSEMTMGTNKQAGTWKLTGDEVEITAGAGKPMKAKASSDGKSLTPILDAEQEKMFQGVKMTFQKSE